MGNCYVCGCELTSDNSSVEHILLNAIGGRLKSRDLLCRQHNSSFGDEIDAELAKQLGFLSVMLNITRDDGKLPRGARVTNASSGEQMDILPGGRLTTARPQIERVESDDGTHVVISARDECEARRIVRSVHRKHPHIDVDKIMASLQPVPKSAGPLHFGLEIGGPLVRRSVCKTAVSYFIYSGGDRSYISHLIDYIGCGGDPSPVAVYYPPHDIIEKSGEDVLHTIALVGDRTERLLYAYVEFFSAVQYLVILNSDYPADFRAIYCYDVLAASEVKRKWEVRLSRSDLEAACQGQYFLDDRIGVCLGRVFAVIHRRLRDERRGETIEKVIQRVFESHTNETFFTPTMAAEIADGVAKAFLPDLIHEHKGQ